MKKKKWIAAILAGVVCAALAGAGIAWKFFGNEGQTFRVSAEKQMENTENLVELAKKAVSGVKYAEEIKSADTKITLKETTAVCDGKGASFKDGVLTITEEGSYEISGTLTDGRIEVEADKESKIKILLNGVDVTCSDYAPFTVWQADKVSICLAEGTTNSFTDGGDYYDAESTEEKMPSAAFYSKDDLEFSGDGTLKIYASCNDGLAGKDAISFASGTYMIEAADDAIVGKDSVAVLDGTFSITAEGHGMKSSKEEDEEKGFVSVAGGTFDIHAKADGIHAVSYVWIEGGTFTINSQDDGIHSDGLVYICGGEVLIETSYEGIEASYINIKNGTIDLTASDDGMNATNGQAAQGGMQKMRQEGAMPEGGNPQNMGGIEQSDGSGACSILIEGGEISVNADGDGLDSNGSIYISGGTVKVDGPLNSGNGIFDYDSELVVTGGSLIGAGSSGMLQNVSQNSKQPGLALVLDTAQRAGTEIVIKDKEGKELLSYSPGKTFSALVVSIPDFEVGNSYSVYLDGSLYKEVELDSVSAGDGTMENRGGMGGRNMPDRGNMDGNVENRGGRGGENMPDKGNMDGNVEKREDRRGGNMPDKGSMDGNVEDKGSMEDGGMKDRGGMGNENREPRQDFANRNSF